MCEQHKESKKNNPESSFPCVEPEFCILSCLNFSPAFELRWCSDGRWKLEGGVGHLRVRWILFSCTAIYLSLEVGGWMWLLNFYKTDPGARTRRLHSGPAECEGGSDVTATTHGWKHKRKITQSVYISCHVHSQNRSLITPVSAQQHSVWDSHQPPSFTYSLWTHSCHTSAHPMDF